jgi:hypothetical protein
MVLFVFAKPVVYRPFIGTTVVVWVAGLKIHMPLVGFWFVGFVVINATFKKRLK